MMATVATTLVAAVPMYSEAIIEAGLRSTLADAPPAESGVEAAFRADVAEFASVVEGLDALGASRLPGELATVTLARTDTYALPTELVEAPDGGERITSIGALVSDEPMLTSAESPGSSDADAMPSILHRDAAAELGLGVGDRIELARRGSEPVTLEITGLFQADDRADERWFDQPAVRDGLTINGSFTEVGPFLVAADDFVTLGGTANYRWRVIVEPSSVSTADLDRLRTGAAGMQAAIGDELQASSLVVTTRLPSLASATDTSIGATSAVIAAILLQLVGVALYGVGLAASVLVSSRAVETSMLRSRGATAEQLGAMAAAEAVVIAVPAVILGPWFGAWVVASLERWGPVSVSGLDLQPAVSGSAVLASAAVGLCVVAIVTWPAIRSARGFARAQAARARPEGPLLLQRTGLDVAVVALAALGLWRLSDSSAATSDLAGRLGTDPVLVLAPTLGVIAASLITLRLISVVAAASQRYTSSQGALSLALAGWELARRPARTARTSVLIVLSVTVGAFSAVHGASWQQSQRDQADAAVSADVVIVADGRPTAEIPSVMSPAAYRSLAGVEALAAIDRTTAAWSATLGAVPVVVADTRALDRVLRLRDDLARVDYSLLHEPIDMRAIDLGPAEDNGLVAGDLVLDFRLTSEASAARGDIEISATLVDGNGTVLRVASPGIPIDVPAGEIVLPMTTASVPGYDLAITGPVRLLEIEIAAPSVVDDAPDPSDPSPEPLLPPAVFDLELGPARIGDRVVEWDTDWVAGTPSLPNAIAPPTATLLPGPGLHVRLDTGLTQQVSADVVVRYGTAEFGTGTGAPVPALVTPALLAESGVGIGDVATARVAGGVIEVRIEGVVPVVPFSTDDRFAIMIDWATYSADRWVRSRRIEPVDEWAVAVGAASVDELRATVSGAPFSSEGFGDRRQRARDIARAPVAVGLAGSLGLAIAASLVVAGVGLLLTAVVGARERRPAFAVLRALGTRAGELRRWLLLETLPLVGLSAAAGVAAGVGLARLGLPSLAVGSDGERAVPSPQLVVPWGMLAVIVSIAVAAGMALPVVTARLLRQHRTADELRIGDTT